MKTIFYNGNIITLDNGKTEQALCVENGIISKVGENKEIISDKENAEIIDLDGKTIMPAFIDSHSHLLSYANSFLHASLDGADSFKDIIDRLKLFAKNNNVTDKEWLVGDGYDHNNLKERSHPSSK